jgi:carboxymethylenebutenolidase
MTGIRSRMTTFGEMPAFVVVPDTDAKLPCVVVMHERYGFVRHTRELAERFARDGFVAIAPDFYFKHLDQDALHRGERVTTSAIPRR